MVATLQPGSVFRMGGGFGQSVYLGIAGGSAGVAYNTSSPPTGYNGSYEFDTSKVHSATWRNAAASLPTGNQKYGWCEQYWISRDAGTISQECSVRQQSGTLFQLKWNTSGNLDVYVGNVRVCTIAFSTNTFAHVSIYLRTLDNFSSAGSADATHQVVVYKDGALQVNRLVTPVGNSLNLASAASLGENAAAGSNTLKWKIIPLWASYMDWDNPLPKITVKEWGFTLAATPVWDEGVKATGTDAAALVDERPPTAAFGQTTEPANEYFTVGPLAMQTCVMANSLLSSGDVLYAVKVMPWSRCTSPGKTSSADIMGCTPNGKATLAANIVAGDTSITYNTPGGDGRPINNPNVGPNDPVWNIRIDNEVMTVTADNTGTGTLTVTRGTYGTTAAAHTAGAIIRWFEYLSTTGAGGATGYSEDLAASGLEYIHPVSPENAQWSSYAFNAAYLDAVEFGYSCNPGSNPLGQFAVDALVVEAAYVKSGDTLTLPTPAKNDMLLYQQQAIMVPKAQSQARPHGSNW